MRSILLSTFLTTAALVTIAPTNEADAHLRMVSHLSRHGDTQKAPHCGLAGSVRGDNIYIAKPGTQVLLVWDEFINHPGVFKIDFDLDGDDDFTNPILPCVDQTSIADCFDTANTNPNMVNNIPDEVAAVQNYLYTLPNVECDNCTLQVSQIMHDKPPFTDPGNEMYYQCIDIILDADGPDELTLLDDALADAGPTAPDAGAGVTDAGTSGAADAAGQSPGATDAGGEGSDDGGDGGCAASGSDGGLYPLLLLGLFFFARRRCQGEESAY